MQSMHHVSPDLVHECFALAHLCCDSSGSGSALLLLYHACPGLQRSGQSPFTQQLLTSVNMWLLTSVHMWLANQPLCTEKQAKEESYRLAYSTGKRLGSGHCKALKMVASWIKTYPYHALTQIFVPLCLNSGITEIACCDQHRTVTRLGFLLQKKLWHVGD